MCEDFLAGGGRAGVSRTGDTILRVTGPWEANGTCSLTASRIRRLRSSASGNRIGIRLRGTGGLELYGRRVR